VARNRIAAYSREETAPKTARGRTMRSTERGQLSYRTGWGSSHWAGWYRGIDPILRADFSSNEKKTTQIFPISFSVRKHHAESTSAAFSIASTHRFRRIRWKLTTAHIVGPGLRKSLRSFSPNFRVLRAVVARKFENPALPRRSAEREVSSSHVRGEGV
jgi:hypothetical protein